MVLSVFYPKSLTLSMASQGFLVLLSLCNTGLWLSNSQTWNEDICIKTSDLCSSSQRSCHSSFVSGGTEVMRPFNLREADRSQTEATLLWEVKMWTQNIKALSTVWKNQRSQLGVVRSCIWCFESLINLKRLECTLVRRKPQDPEAYRQLPGMKRHVGHVMTLWDSKTAKKSDNDETWLMNRK